MQKKDKILAAVTILTVVILVVCVIYDRSSALMARTLAYTLPNDTKLIDIDKHGFLFYRVSYEAKVEINPEHPEEILTCFLEGYGDSGRMLSRDEFDTMTQYMFENFYSYVEIRPEPSSGTSIWMFETDTPEGHHILHFMDLEEGNHGYLYIYYVR